MKKKIYDRRVTVITDASFCPRTKASGWAAWLTINTKDTQGRTITVRKHYAEKFKHIPTSSHEAELWAALNGIALAVKHNPEYILIQSDCVGALNKIDNHQSCIVQRFRRKIKLSPSVVIECRHVKGHSGRKDARSYVNRWCDYQARRIMAAERSLADGET